MVLLFFDVSFLFLKFCQVVLQRIQVTFVVLLELFNPGRDFVESFQRCFAVSFPTLLFDVDQPAFGKDLHMKGDCLTRHIKFPGH